MTVVYIFSICVHVFKEMDLRSNIRWKKKSYVVLANSLPSYKLQHFWQPMSEKKSTCEQVNIWS